MFSRVTYLKAFFINLQKTFPPDTSSNKESKGTIIRPEPSIETMSKKLYEISFTVEENGGNSICGKPALIGAETLR